MYRNPYTMVSWQKDRRKIGEEKEEERKEEEEDITFFLGVLHPLQHFLGVPFLLRIKNHSHQYKTSAHQCSFIGSCPPWDFVLEYSDLIPREGRSIQIPPNQSPLLSGDHIFSPSQIQVLWDTIPWFVNQQGRSRKISFIC